MDDHLHEPIGMCKIMTNRDYERQKTLMFRILHFLRWPIRIIIFIVICAILYLVSYFFWEYIRISGAHAVIYFIFPILCSAYVVYVIQDKWNRKQANMPPANYSLFSPRKRVEKYITWCYKEYSRKYRHSNLAEHLYSFQYSQSSPTPSVCRLTHLDECSVDIILEAFLIHLSQAYFQYSLKIDREVTKRSKEEYFMFVLYSFLNEHQGSESICSNILSTYAEKCNSIPRSYRYKLTDFGIVYQKMLYISLSYCQSNIKLAPFCRNNDLPFIAKNIETASLELFSVSENDLSHMFNY